MKKLFKIVFIAAIASAIGYSIYYGGKKGIAMFRAAREAEKQAELAKKKSSAKLEQSKSAAEKEAAVAEKEAYTFFETLGDPEMNKIVGLNNNIQSQPVVPPRPMENKAGKKATATPETKEKANASPDMVQHASLLTPPETHEFKSKPEYSKSNEPPVKVGKVGDKKVPVRTEPSAKSDSRAEDDKTYTVQISSFKELAPAQSLQTRLQKKGYPAYLLLVDTPGKGAIYRVFLGKYIGADKAKAAANKARQEENVNGVVVLLQE